MSSSSFSFLFNIHPFFCSTTRRISNTFDNIPGTRKNKKCFMDIALGRQRQWLLEGNKNKKNENCFSSCLILVILCNSLISTFGSCRRYDRKNFKLIYPNGIIISRLFDKTSFGSFTEFFRFLCPTKLIEIFLGITNLNTDLRI